MLLQTNSYVVPREKRSDHARLLRRFRATLQRLGCDHFECYEQVGANWTNGESSGRFVQIMRFRDRRHQLAVQAAEKSDPQSQKVIAEFCELVNMPYQQQQGLFAVGFYTSVLPALGGGRASATAEPEAAEEPVPDESADDPNNGASEVDSNNDAAPPDAASEEEGAIEELEFVDPPAEPNAADESIAAESINGSPTHEGYVEEESDPDREASHESEPFSR